MCPFVKSLLIFKHIFLVIFLNEHFKEKSVRLHHFLKQKSCQIVITKIHQEYLHS